jgi:hypothetical protein
LRYWSGLQAEDTQKLIVSGVDLMMKATMKILDKKSDPKTQLTIQDALPGESDEDSDEDGKPKTL